MRTRFITSAADPSQFPGLDLPEVAFLGRSNVGKSSLLNVLTGAKIARTSRTPGRTQLVNFFEVTGRERTFALADLPGYGYAKVPGRVVRTWEPLVEGYLETRRRLSLVLLLFDARRDVRADDVGLLEFLHATVGARGKTITPVVTKIDKLPKAKRKPALARIAAATGRGPGEVIGVSATARLGLEALADHVWDRV